MENLWTSENRRLLRMTALGVSEGPSRPRDASSKGHWHKHGHVTGRGHHVRCRRNEVGTFHAAGVADRRAVVPGCGSAIVTARGLPTGANTWQSAVTGRSASIAACTFAISAGAAPRASGKPMHAPRPAVPMSRPDYPPWRRPVAACERATRCAIAMHRLFRGPPPPVVPGAATWRLATRRQSPGQA